MKSLNKKMECKYCSSKNVIKKGKRKNKFEEIQLFQCKSCKKRFTLKELKNKTYQPKIILNAISYYNLGNTQTQVSKLISQRYKVKPPQRTISEWINQYKNTCTYSKLRNKAKKLCTPKSIIFKKTLNHIQPYTFQFHKAKLYCLFHDIKYNNQFTNISKFYEPIKNYLKEITTNKFPHHIFKQKHSFRNHRFLNLLEIQRISNSSEADITNKNILKGKNNQKPEQRASKLKFSTLKIKKLSKNNLANKLAKLALQTATANKDRHTAIQNFMLINDSTTIAAEIPVYLTKDDILYFISRGFQPDLINQKTPITGHIDILQIRNSLIHIIDYKPDANTQNPIHQLTIYALALASRTKLNLHSFKCAWFDDKNYYEFFPLHVVYKLPPS